MNVVLLVAIVLIVAMLLFALTYAVGKAKEILLHEPDEAAPHDGGDVSGGRPRRLYPGQTGWNRTPWEKRNLHV